MKLENGKSGNQEMKNENQDTRKEKLESAKNHEHTV